MLATRRRDIAAIAYGFMASKALFAALEIGLFSLLADGPRTSAALAAETGVAPTGSARCCGRSPRSACSSRTTRGSAMRPAAQRHLVRGARADIGEYYRLQVGRQIYPALTHLDAGIAGHGVAFAGFDELMGSADEAATFTVGQHCASLELARKLVDQLPLARPARCSTSAAGSGAFSIAFCERHPALRATLLDFPQTLDVARPYRDAAGLTDRIALIPGNATSTDWPRRAGRRADVVPAQRARPRTRPTRRSPPRTTACAPAGCWSSTTSCSTTTSPARTAAALWFLQYLAWRPDAWSFTGAELGDRMAKAGFLPTPAEQVVPETTKLVLARKGEDR